MTYAYIIPHHLRPAELWRLRLSTGEEALATLSPTADSKAAVWFLDDHLQDAAQFQDREAAITWAEDIRQMLTAGKSA